MTEKKPTLGVSQIKAVLGEQEDFLKTLVQTVVQEVLEAEMEETVGAGKGERAAGRLGYLGAGTTAGS